MFSRNLKIQNFDLYLNILFSFFYIFGSVLFSLDFSFVFIRGLSELFLYLCAFGFFTAVFLSYKYLDKFNYKKFLIWTIITFFSTLIIEMIGTATGIVFGSYKYGQILSLQILNTPLIIGFNWVILIVSGCEIARHFMSFLSFLKKEDNTLKTFFTATISAVLITFFDYIMEPVAVYLDYWNWGSDDIYAIPTQNYIAWFVIAFTFSLFYLTFKTRIKSSFVKNIFWLQFIFFSLLRIFMI